MSESQGYVFAQFGKRSERKRSLSILMNQAELPGQGWRVVDERTWRSGSIGPRSDAAVRSLKAGGVIAWRSFGQKEPPRGVWIQVGPYGTVEDAESAVPELFSRSIKSSRFEGRVSEEKSIVDISIPGVAHAAFIEQSIEGTSVGPRNSKYVVGSVSQYVFGIGCTGRADGWPWAEVLVLASLQADKVANYLRGTDESA